MAYRLTVTAHHNWLSPVKYEAWFDLRVGDLRWRHGAKRGGWGPLLLTPCCGEIPHPPNGAWPRPFCRRCWTLTPYGEEQQLGNFDLWGVNRLLRDPLRIHFTPLEAELLGGDLQAIAVELYRRWSREEWAEVPEKPPYRSAAARVADRAHRSLRPVAESLNATSFELGEWAATIEAQEEKWR